MNERGQGYNYKEGSRFCWRVVVDGRTYVVKAKTASERKSRREALLDRLRAGKPLLDRKSKTLTTGEYLHQWLETHVKPPQKAHKTYRAYRQSVENYVIPAIGLIYLTKLTSTDVRLMVSRLSTQGLSASTVRSALTVLKTALTAAVNEEPQVITINPARRVQPPKRVTPKRSIVNPSNHGELIDYCLGGDAGRYGPIVVLALCTGLRVSELMGLRESNVSSDSSSITLTHSVEWLPRPRDEFGIPYGYASWRLSELKSEKAKRTIPLSDLAREAFERIRSERVTLRANPGYTESDFVVTTESGNPIRERNFQRGLDAILDHLGMPHVGLHALRRTFATMLASARVAPNVLQTILGHESFETTSRHYVATLDADAAAAVSVIGRKTSRTNNKRRTTMAQTIISIDIETNGNLPGLNSMLSLGAVAFAPDKTEIGHWYGKFQPWPGSRPDEATMKWWQQFPDQLAEATTDAVEAVEQTNSFIEWVKSLPGNVVLASDPATFDGMFVNWYCCQVAGGFDALPWKHRILDCRSVRMALTGSPYADAHTAKLARFYGIEFEGMPHNALDDARFQGRCFMQLLDSVPDEVGGVN